MYFTAMVLALADGTIDEFLNKATAADRKSLSIIWDMYCQTPVEVIFKRPAF